MINQLSIMPEVSKTSLNSDWLSQCYEIMTAGEDQVRGLRSLKNISSRLLERCTQLETTLEEPNKLPLLQAVIALREKIEELQGAFSEDVDRLRSQRDNVRSLARYDSNKTYYPS